MSTIHPHSPADLPPHSTPAEAQGDVVMGDHTYDGIQEYDNPIPGWWKWLFIGTIVFSPIYIMWFHAPGMERDLVGQYDRAFAANMQLKFGEMPPLGDPGQDVLTYMNDQEWLAVGKAAFATHCKTCHGANGASGPSLTGPNLTDNHYKNITTAADIVTVLQEGAAGGAMPPWKTKLHPNELILTAAYVANLRGTFAQGGKAAEGNEIPAWGP